MKVDLAKVRYALEQTYRLLQGNQLALRFVDSNTTLITCVRDAVVEMDKVPEDYLYDDGE